MKKALKKYWAVFVLPTLAAFIIGFVVPFVQGLYLTFCKFVTIDRATFVGLKNYAYALKDATFGHAFWFTAAFAVLSTVLINVIALAIALALTRNMKGATRTLQTKIQACFRSGASIPITSTMAIRPRSWVRASAIWTRSGRSPAAICGRSHPH